MLWGIDLGGTKIEGVIIPSITDPTPVVRLRIATEAKRGYEHVISRLVQLVQELSRLSGSNPTVIGVGHPGVLDPKTHRVKNSNTTSLNGEPVQEELKKRLGIEVRMANDANCFTLAEATFGSGRGYQTVFGVILGTGVGGGIVVGGKVLPGAQGIAGEWGHNPLDERAPLCYCGRRGCVEATMSGPALEQRYFEKSGEHRKLSEIASRVAIDSAARETVSHLTTSFGKAIGAVINILDPHVIVLGGGVSNIDALYIEGREAAKKWVFNDELETPIVKNSLGDSAGVFGAALLAA